MRSPLLLLAALVVAGNALAAGTAMAAEASFQGRAPQQPALYSFVDVFRLTVSGPAAALQGADAAPEAPIRVAAPPPAVAEPRFAVTTRRPQPDTWLLVVAGLALAGWVAHRRLVHSL